MAEESDQSSDQQPDQQPAAKTTRKKSRKPAAKPAPKPAKKPAQKSTKTADRLKAHRKETWIRLLFVLLFFFVYTVAKVVLVAVVVIQFGFVLITGERHRDPLAFGASLSEFIYRILRFITFNSDDKPFPFDDWPSVSKSDTTHPH